MFYVESVTIGRRSLFSRIWQSFKITCEIIGYSRAAAHLAQQGKYDLAKECMMEVAKLKS